MADEPVPGPSGLQARDPQLPTSSAKKRPAKKAGRPPKTRPTAKIVRAPLQSKRRRKQPSSPDLSSSPASSATYKTPDNRINTRRKAPRQSKTLRDGQSEREMPPPAVQPLVPSTPIHLAASRPVVAAQATSTGLSSMASLAQALLNQPQAVPTSQVQSMWSAALGTSNVNSQATSSALGAASTMAATTANQSASGQGESGATSLTLSSHSRIANLLPKFNKAAPVAWFVRLESLLSMYSLTPRDKYVILASLVPADMDVSMQHTWLTLASVHDVLKYDLLKQHLLSCTTMTPAERSYRLMTLPFLGQKKPSELMAELLQLVDPPGSFSNDNLHLFLSRLPFDLARNHHEKSATDIQDPASFALKLDRDLEASRSRYRGGNGSFFARANSVDPRQQLTPRGSQSQPPQPPQPQRNDRPGREIASKPAAKLGSGQNWQGSKADATATSKICSYHMRFGSAARSCQPHCQWSTLCVLTDEEPLVADLLLAENQLYQPIAGSYNFIRCKLSDIEFFIDTGSSLSFLPESVVSTLKLQICPGTVKRVRVADGRFMPVLGTCTLAVDFGVIRSDWKFHVARVTFAILGRDFLVQKHLLVDSAGPQLLRRPGSPSLMAIRAETLVDVAKQVGLPKQFLSYSATFGMSDSVNMQSFKVDSTFHYIKTEGQPCASPVRRLSPVKLVALRKYIEDMLAGGVIRPSSSPWASPLQIAQKADGSWRICGDYRRLNLVTQKDSYPLPNILDVQSFLHGRKVFSKFDLYKGFWQLPMAPEDIQKTAMVTPLGLFEFVRMPFGLRNASQTFQRVVDSVFRGMEDVFVYVDDVLVASVDESSHLVTLKKVFDKLSQNGLGIHIAKCEFLKPSLRFLGFTIDKEGATVPEHRVQALLDIPLPSSPRGMQAFLGAVNFYRRFFAKLAGLAAPLYKAANLLPATKPRHWDDAVKAAFDQVKHCIAAHTKLFHPRPGAHIAITTDASDLAMGGTLEQFTDGSWQPLAFFSKAWRPPQAKYAPYDKELVAIVESIKHFRYYIEGAVFTIFTDHLPLVRGLKKACVPLSSMQQRHFAFISEYTDDLRHLPGKNNLVADLLSRPDGSGGAQRHVKSSEDDSGQQLASVDLPTRSTPRDDVFASLSNNFLQELAKAQSGDQDLQRRMRAHPERFCTKTIEGVDLIGDSRGSFRIYVSPGCRTKVFQLVHAVGHPGIRQSKANITRSFLWPDMDRTVRAYVQACVSCQKTKTLVHDKRPLQHFPQPEARFEHLHMDIVGPLPPAKGNLKYWLTIVDRFSRYPTAIPLRAATTKAILAAFVDKWVAHFGLPMIVTTDQGSAFMSGLFRNFLQDHGIKWQPTTAYHPQANGLVERFHRRLKEAVTAMGGSWAEKLPWALLAIRNANGPDIPFSPAQALFGINTRLPHSVGTVAQAMPLEDFVGKRIAFQIPDSVPGRWHTVQKEPKASSLEGIAWVLVKRHQKRPLQHAYAGPFKLLESSDKHATIEYHNKRVVISRDRVKPMRNGETPFMFECLDDDNFVIDFDR